MTEITSTQTGNWNATATWVGGVVPGEDDTAIIDDGHTVTVNVNTTIGALTGIGITIDGGILAIDEDITLTLKNRTAAGIGIQLQTEDNVISKITQAAGSSIILNNNRISLTSTYSDGGYSRWTINGTSDSRCAVTGTSGSRIYPGNSIAGHGIDWEYCTFDGLDEGTNGNVVRAMHTYDLETTGNSKANHCLFKNCGSWQFGCTSTLSDIDMDFQYNDFRNITSRTVSVTSSRVVFERKLTAAITGTNLFRYNTFYPSGGKISMHIRDADCAGNVCYNSYIWEVWGFNNDFNACAFYSPSGGTTNQLLTGSGLSTITNSLFGADVFNNHGIEGSNSATNGTIEVYGNVLESANTADNLHIGDKNNNLEIYKNIYIGKGCAVTLGMKPGGASTVNIKRNTFAIEASPFGLLYETGIQGGTVNCASNMFYDKRSDANYACHAGTGIGLDVLDYTDYNAFHPNGDLDRYHNITMTSKTEGDAGFGLNDFDANPQFVDPTRTIGTFDTSLGGAGTMVNFFTEMLKINGVAMDGSLEAYDQDYNVSDCIAYITAGFTPQNIALKGAGDPADGSPDIGAVDVIDLRGSAIMSMMEG